MCSVYEMQGAGKSSSKAILTKRTRAGLRRIGSYVKVTAPSTIANLGPGFDVFGLAHSAFRDVLEIEITDGRGIDIKVDGVDSKLISCQPMKNTAGYVANLLVNNLPSGCGLGIRIKKGVPVGRGLGSSAASAAACIVGLNRLLRLGLPNNQMVSLAAKGEIVSAGSEHADNVAASILGGFIIIQSYNPLSIISLDPPSNIGIALAIPKIPTVEMKTEKARKILPSNIPIKSFVHNVGHASSMVAGIMLGDVEMMGQGMFDVIVEPVRSKLIPGYNNVKISALRAGASGVAISGAGHTMVAIVDELKAPTKKVAESMKKAIENEGIACETFTSKPSRGAEIIEEH